MPNAPPQVPSSQSREARVASSTDAAPLTSSHSSSYQEALAFYERGDYRAAAQTLAAGPESHEATATRSALFARIYANLGNLAEARRWAEKALDADKLDAGLYYLHAMILQEQGVIAEAVASLKRALYLNPDLVLAYFALGNLALRHQKVQEAAKQFSNALSLLQCYRDDEALPFSDGLAAGRLRALIQSTLSMEQLA